MIAVFCRMYLLGPRASHELLSASSGRLLAAVPTDQAVLVVRQTGWVALMGLLQVVLVGHQADGQVVPLEDLGVFELREDG